MNRILLVDDHPIFREGLKSLLDDLPGHQVVASANDGREALTLVESCHPDVIVMDVSMPNLNGIDATRQIHSQWPATRVIILSMNAERRFVVEAFAAGAKAYVLKENALEELVRAVEAVVAGRSYVSPGVAGVLVDAINRPLPTGGTVELSAREREVLQLIAEGRSTKEVAAELGVSVKTIETHRMKLMQKVGVHSIAELTKHAIRAGLTTL